MRQEFDDDVDVTFSHDLYHAGLAAIRAAVETLPDDVETVMVIGHNPGWEDAASRLCSQDVTMTTANVALVEVHADSWAEALDLDACWKMNKVLRPKD